MSPHLGAPPVTIPSASLPPCDGGCTHPGVACLASTAPAAVFLARTQEILPEERIVRFSVPLASRLPRVPSNMQERFVSEALSLAGARAAATAACACTSWRNAADDPRVWRDACTREHGAAVHEVFDRPIEMAPRTTGTRSSNPWRDECGRRARAARNWDECRVETRTCKGGCSMVTLLATGRKAGRTIVAAAMFDGAIQTWDVSTGEPLRGGCVPSQGMPAALATDGERVAFIARGAATGSSGGGEGERRRMTRRAIDPDSGELGEARISTHVYVLAHPVGGRAPGRKEEGKSRGEEEEEEGGRVLGTAAVSEVLRDFDRVSVEEGEALLVELAPPPPVGGLPGPLPPGGAPAIFQPGGGFAGTGGGEKLAMRAGRVVVGCCGGWLCAWDAPGVRSIGGGGEAPSAAEGGEGHPGATWRLLIPGGDVRARVYALGVSPDGCLVCAVVDAGLHMWSLPPPGTSTASSSAGPDPTLTPVSSTSLSQLSHQLPGMSSARCLAIGVNGAVALGDGVGGVHVWRSRGAPPSCTESLSRDGCGGGGAGRGGDNDVDKDNCSWRPAVSANVFDSPVRDVALTGDAVLAVSGEGGGSICVWKVLRCEDADPAPEAYDFGDPDDQCVAMTVEWDCVVLARDHRRHPRILDFLSPGGAGGGHG